MTYVEAGSFTRDTAYIADRITRDGRDGWPVEPGRYRLVVSRACPWANRAIIVRRLLGLEPVLSMGICGPEHDELSWTFGLDPGGRDPVLGIERLQEAYLNRFPDYDKGITVPAMVHRDINPTGVVPVGPDLAGWLSDHHREQLGGRPFGDGTPPPPPAGEEVPADHTPLGASTCSSPENSPRHDQFRSVRCS